MRSGLVFVGVVVAGAIVVFLLAVTQFTSSPFDWAYRHLDYVAAAVLPVIPIAILAAVTSARNRDSRHTDVAHVAAAAEPTPRPAKQPATATTVTAARPQLRATVIVHSDDGELAPTGPGTRFSSVEQLAVASVLDRGRSVADVAKTLKVRQTTVEMWVARARGESPERN